MGRSSPKTWATFVIKKLPLVNNHRKGKNSPNLVTLKETYVCGNEDEKSETFLSKFCSKCML
jgi:hypothetical protein